jgi:hypothetical protein
MLPVGLRRRRLVLLLPLLQVATSQQASGRQRDLVRFDQIASLVKLA